MRVHLSPLLIPLAAVAVWTHTASQLTAAYMSVTVHELAHLLAALCIGLCPDSITLSPFGAHLILKNKIVRSIADEIILYAAGPLINGIIAAVCAIMGFTGLYRINAALFIINILPVPPLDGGIILKRIIAYRLGLNISERVCAAISFTAGAVFFAMALYGAYTGAINPSMFIMAIFLFGSAVTGRELYNVDFISGLSAKKRSNRVKIVVIRDQRDRFAAVRGISPAYTTIGLSRSPDGDIRLIDEPELIFQILN
ncbi:MAG: site-2 protease family protein [Clostridia bacterium]|nr:site-2 protease family protein [Clostridia bacterium]